MTQRIIRGVLSGVLVSTLTAGLAWAQAMGPRKLEVSFKDGHVTIVAQNVTVREVLQEWGRKGGSRMVNVDKLGGAVVPYLEFQNQPEAAVLRSLLRDVPGYGAAPRVAPSPDSSTIATLFVLPSRTVPVSGSSASSMPQPAPQQPQQSQPQLGPRAIDGSVDSEIPPARQVGELPPSTPGSNTNSNNQNLRTGPGGTVTSTIPGVVIPGPTTPAGGQSPLPGSPSKPTTGRGGGGGGLR